MPEISATTLTQSGVVYSQFSYTRCPYLIQPSGSFLPYFSGLHSRLFTAEIDTELNLAADADIDLEKDCGRG